MVNLAQAGTAPARSWLQRSAAKADLVSVGIAVRGLAHAVRVGFLLHGVESPLGDLARRAHRGRRRRACAWRGRRVPAPAQCTRSDAPQAPTRLLCRLERRLAGSP